MPKSLTKLKDRFSRARELRSPEIPGGLATHRGGAYATGIPEQDVEHKAVEDGRAGSLDPSTVGVNSHPHAIDHGVESHVAARGVISHDTREAVQVLDTELAGKEQAVRRTEATALEAIDEHASAQRHWLVQRHRMRAAGLPLPGRRGSLHMALLLLLLFGGEWGLLALGFQVMGLSDTPWIPGLAFTDDLHLAALSAVVALVYLGHVVGDHVRRIEHALAVRLRADADRDDFPKPATFDIAWTAAAFTAATVGMIALSSIRTEYLEGLGVPSNYWAFLGMQSLILAAATGIGFAHSNPEAARWRSVEEARAAATDARATAVDEHVKAVSEVNSLVDSRLATMARAGHHIDTDAAHTRAMMAAFKRRYILSQLEPAQEQLFEKHLETPRYGDGELLALLTGVTPFPTVAKAVSQPVMNALAAALEELSALRARIDQIEIGKLDLPDADGLFRAPARIAHEQDGNAPAGPGAGPGSGSGSEDAGQAPRLLPVSAPVPGEVADAEDVVTQAGTVREPA